MSAAPSILSPEAVTGAHGSSLQRLVSRIECSTCRHWEAKSWVTPEGGVCWMHYGLAKEPNNSCDRWNNYARHAE